MAQFMVEKRRARADGHYRTTFKNVARKSPRPYLYACGTGSGASARCAGYRAQHTRAYRQLVAYDTLGVHRSFFFTTAASERISFAKIRINWKLANAKPSPDHCLAARL
jgi:hypothetical protein